jgi:hypothetical protein
MEYRMAEFRLALGMGARSGGRYEGVVEV